MPDPERRGEPSADASREHAMPRPRPGQSTPREPAADQSAGRYDHPEAQLGGADAVEKTTYVVGEGTEPDTRQRGDYIARDAARGANVGVWIIGGIAALIGLVYAIGIFR